MVDVPKNDESHLKSLIERAKNGDNMAFEEVYIEYYTPIFRYVMSRVKDRNTAEDITQTVFLKVWQFLPRFNNAHTSPLAFFFTVARNTLIDFFRKNSHGEVVSDEIIENISDTHTVSDSDTTSRELRELFIELIDKLSEDQKEIITLFYNNDMTYAEIATLTNRREDAVRQIHSRAIKKLRVLYSKYYE